MTEQDKAVFTLLSLLLQYPDHPSFQVVQLRQMADELVDSPVKVKVHGFLDYVQQQALQELAEGYVATFDFSERSNMDLTSLLYPDDRKRGQVLSSIKSIYSQSGLEVDSGELPDYLPMILDFLSIGEEKNCAEVLGIVRPGMEKLWLQLENDDSPYAGVIECCLLSTATMTSKVTGVEEGVS